MKTQMQALVSRQAQKGVILIITLIAMVALAIASVAMLRGVDTGNVISGNMAFRQSTLQAGDIGLELAFAALPAIISTNTTANTNIANRYYATMQAVDSKGVPTSVNWGNVPCRDSAGGTVTCSTQAYQVKYVIDRLCATIPADTSAPPADCLIQPATAASEGHSQKSTGVPFNLPSAAYFRITVQVSGPRNTQSFVQAIVSRA